MSEDRVQSLYVSTFGRPADPAGLNYWTAVAAGGDDAAAWQTLADSPEFQDAYGGADAAAVVTGTYQNAFGREPDAEGLAFWTASVGDSPTGGQLAQLVAQIIGSAAEGTDDAATLVNKTAVADAVTASISSQAGAEADLSGLQYETFADADALLATVTADPASVEAAQAQVDQVAADVLAANDVPTDPGNPEPSTLTVDAAQPTDAEAGVYQTIQEAVDAAQAGATIEIAAGTYHENLTLKSDLTLVGGEGVVVQSAEGEVGVAAEGTQNLRLQDIAFVQGGALATHLDAEGSTAISLENVSFTGNAEAGADTDGVVLGGGNAARLINVQATGYGGDGIVVSADEDAATQDVLLKDVSATANGGAGIAVDADGTIEALAFDGTTLLQDNDTGIRFTGDGSVTGSGEGGRVLLNGVDFAGSTSGSDIVNESGVLVDAGGKASEAPVYYAGTDPSLSDPTLGLDTIGLAAGADATITNFDANFDKIALPWLSADPAVGTLTDLDPATLQTESNDVFANADDANAFYDVVIATGLPGSGFDGESAATWLLIDVDGDHHFNQGDQVVAVDLVGGALEPDNVTAPVVV